MKKGFLKRIGAGIVNGLPMVQSIVQSVKGGEPAPGQPQKKFDWLTFVAEAATVAAIVALCLKVITFEQLKELLEILK